MVLRSRSASARRRSLVPDGPIYILPIPVADRDVFATGLAILREWAGNALLSKPTSTLNGRCSPSSSGLPTNASAVRRCRGCSTEADAERQPIEGQFRRMTPGVAALLQDWYVPTSG
jgi:hypothetical protein